MNILFLTYWSMKESLTQSYVIPYITIISKILPKGSKIYLLTLEKKEYAIAFKEKEALKVSLLSENIVWIPKGYVNFGFRGGINFTSILFTLIFTLITKKIKFIHARCVVSGTLGYFLSLFSLKPLIIDSYEPHAEAMVENGTWKKDSLAFKILFYLEKLETKRAKVCIGLTEKTPEYALKAYGIAPKKHYVKPACVDFKKFDAFLRPNYSLINEPHNSLKKYCVYAGKVGGIYLEQEIFDFLKECEIYWNGDFKAIILTNTPVDTIEKHIKAANLKSESVWYGEVPHNEVAKYMSLANFALNPVKSVPTKRYCTSIKDGEYWAMGLPIVITPDISDDSSIIESNKIGSIIRSLDINGYKKAIQEIDFILKSENQIDLKKRIINVAEKNRSFEIAEKVYFEIYK